MREYKHVIMIKLVHQISTHKLVMKLGCGIYIEDTSHLFKSTGKVTTLASLKIFTILYFGTW